MTYVERLLTERIFDRKMDAYDVHTDGERYWVITQPTNLYSQRLFPSLDYTLSFHVGLTARMMATRKSTATDQQQDLLLEYHLAEYQIKSEEGQKSLIAEFFTKTLPEHRGEAVAALSARLHAHPEEWPRTRELWNWRLEVASIANHTTDFKLEMESFSDLLQAAPPTENITTLWPLLEGFLPYIGDAEDWSRIWHNLENYLAKEVLRDAAAAISFYGLMHDRLSGVKPYYGDKAEMILSAGAASDASRTDTLLLIDKLVRKGSYQFKSIQERILAS